MVLSIVDCLDRFSFEAIATAEIRRATAANDLSPPASIPLKRVEDPQRLLYSCAIALPLAASEGADPRKIAEAIAAAFVRSPGGDLDFSIEAVGSGWLHLWPSDRAVAGQLQRLSEFPWPNSVSQPIEGIRRDVFLLQYAHARCCSLLRMARRDGAIAYIEGEDFPWLDGAGRLNLCRRAEFEAIGALFASLDRCARSGDRAAVLKAATALSHRFLNFYRDCRIWGDIQAERPDLARSRLGLVAATRPVLKFLLEERLGVFAPEEL
ncbi:DALR anticodon-binding domain-containing protein [Oxynema aestuarii]|uniref:arginine--tRNA ligase n=1 Tax=Oxynema aestuarii AP17 TaxID=2064643 RepID=A0A6H1TYA9_9CYAN|nr:DALR anticodon-binding domain-containing protein [Oxynema aestuarii]QIZ70349.1 hypothetical protein HCG48_06955 [Oxynema aestuarii AP17]RMH72836.1 MAG: hypothetical protein D6680_18315 [Cyanobacteria bacterium J007]